MNTDTNNSELNGSPVPANLGSIVIDGERVRNMRHDLHELANIFTGVLIASGLLAQHLEGGSLAPYAADIGEGVERGSLLVRDLRSHLLAACGEQEARAGNESGSPL